MSFIWKAERPLRTEEQVAREVHEVSLSRNLDELATVLALMCIRQESNFWCPWNRADPSSEKYDHDSESNDGRSVAYFQQQNGRAGEQLPAGDHHNWWGPMSSRMDLKHSTNQFLDHLADHYHRAQGNPAIATELISNVQRPAEGLRGAYAKHYDYCWSLLRRALDQGPIGPVAPLPPKPTGLQPNPEWRGDPIWLPQVLAAFGVNVSTYTDSRGVRWDQRGHGDFGKIRWVVWHHTGNVNETDEGIAHHPSLGLAANMLVHPDGHTVLTGSGVAFHGGPGIYPGIPEDGINQISIGIECSYGPDFSKPWPEAQVRAMINIGGAIGWFLGLPADHQIAHKEWAGPDNPLGINKQGKPDPANFDMNRFRVRIGERVAAGPTEGEDGLLGALTPQEQREIYEEIMTSGRSRSFLATDGRPIDTLLGYIYNIDGNEWNAALTRAYLFDVPMAVEQIERVAAGKFPEGAWVSEDFNAWLREFGQAYCQGLIKFKRQLAALFAAFAATIDEVAPEPAPVKAPAKKVAKKVAKRPAKKASPRKSSRS